MTSLLQEAQKRQNVEYTLFPKPFLPKTQFGAESESTLEVDSIPTLVLPIIRVNGSSLNFKVAPVNTSKSAMNSTALHGLAFEEQVTWILPVLQGTKKSTKLAPQHANLTNATHFRSLMQNTGIYAIVSLTTPFIALILAPFLAYHISRTDYGALAVLTTLISLMAGITQLGLGSAFFRVYSYEYESEHDRSGVIATVILLLLLVSIPTTITMMIAAPALAQFLFGIPSLTDPIRLASLVILLQNLTVPGLSWLRAENRALFFSIVSVVNLLVNLGVTIVLVGILQTGMIGSLIATGIGYAVIVVCTLPTLLRRAGIRLRIDIAKGLLSFGLPNAASFFSVWILQLSDRYLLSHFGTLAQTASYAVAYNLGGVLAVVIIAPFSLAWPATMFAIAKRDDAPDVFRLVFRWFSIILLFAAFALTLVGVVVLDLLFPRTYASAGPIIPMIAMSIMFYGVYILFTIGASIKRQTWLVVIFTAFAALVNIGLNLVLIRPYGSMGAALSTLIAYGVLAIVAYIVNQRIYPIPFELGIFVIGMLIGIALYRGSEFLTTGQGIYVAFGIHFCVLCLYGGCLALLGKLSPQMLKKWLMKKWRTFWWKHSQQWTPQQWMRL